MARLHVLGAGTPAATADRFGSAYLLQVGETRLMIDCGPAATWKLAKSGFSTGDVDHLFFTHHHYDHDVDYPCFLLNRWGHNDFGQLNRLQVYGPEYTRVLTDRLFHPDYGAWAPDWTARTQHPASLALYQNKGGTLPRPGPSVDVETMQPGSVTVVDNCRVIAGYAQHFQPYLDCLAYRVETPDGVVVFTGDTEPCASVVELSKGADLMVCMCWDVQGEMDANGECAGQCGTTGAAHMAREAGVDKLVLSHMGPGVSSHGGLERGIADVARVFHGEVTFAEELMAVDL